MGIHGLRNCIHLHITIHISILTIKQQIWKEKIIPKTVDETRLGTQVRYNHLL